MAQRHLGLKRFLFLLETINLVSQGIIFPLYVAMATRQIKHRLGQIEYEYNDLIPWTEADQQMADGLAHCLLASDRSMEEADVVFKRSMGVSKSVREGNETFEKVAALLKDAQALAGGYIGAIELGMFSIAQQLSDATNLASDAILNQHAVLTAAHAEYSAVVDARNALLNTEEEENEKIYEQLNGLYLLGYEAENLATELMSFDRAMESVRSVLSVCGRAQEQKLEAVFNTSRDFELLLARVDGQQKVWEAFGLSLILIEYIGKLRSGNQQSSFN